MKLRTSASKELLGARWGSALQGSIEFPLIQHSLLIRDISIAICVQAPGSSYAKLLQLQKKWILKSSFYKETIVILSVYTSMCFLLFLSSYIDCALWCGLRFTVNHCLRSGLSNMWPVDQNLPTKKTNLVNWSIANTLRIGRPSIMGKIQWDKKNHCPKANLKLQINLACMSLQKTKIKHAGTRRIWAYRKAPAGQ